MTSFLFVKLPSKGHPSSDCTQSELHYHIHLQPVHHRSMPCLRCCCFDFKFIKKMLMLSPDYMSASLRTPPSGAQCLPSTPPSPSTTSTSLPALTRRTSGANDVLSRYIIGWNIYLCHFTMITKSSYNV